MFTGQTEEEALIDGKRRKEDICFKYLKLLFGA